MAVALDDSGGLNPRLTKIHVELKEHGNAVSHLTGQLQKCARSFYMQLLRAIRGVAKDAPEAKAFVEAWTKLKADFDAWCAQVLFSDLLELETMVRNVSMWESRLAGLPAIPRPEVRQPAPMPDQPSQPTAHAVA